VRGFAVGLALSLIAGAAFARAAPLTSDDRAALQQSLVEDGIDPSEEPPVRREGIAPDWRRQVDDYFAKRLRDPYSAVKEVTRGPRRAKVREDVYTVWDGWAVCMSVNAKNGYGGYAGAKPYLFVFGEHRILGVIDKADDSFWFRSVVTEECSQEADPPPATTDAGPKVAL
jgi:hypothetical protein